jgi:hypothetical protein
MINDWKNLINARTPEGRESLRIVDEMFEKCKDHQDVEKILAALVSRVHEYRTEPMKFVKSFRGQKDIAAALDKADVVTFPSGRYDSFYRYSRLLDHLELGKDQNGHFHVVGRPYGLSLDLKTLDQFRTLIENGLSVTLVRTWIIFQAGLSRLISRRNRIIRRNFYDL